MFKILHDFWVAQLPMFANDYEFMYLIMDILTVFVFLKLIIFELPDSFFRRRK